MFLEGGEVVFFFLSIALEVVLGFWVLIGIMGYFCWEVLVFGKVSVFGVFRFFVVVYFVLLYFDF